MVRIIFFLFSLLLIVSCATQEPKEIDYKKTIKKDYEVIDSSSRYRPTWIEDPYYWAKEEELPIENLRLYSYESEAQESRDLACEMAKAKVRSEVATQLSSNFTKELQSSQWNDGDIEGSSQQIQVRIEDEVKGNISGVENIKVHWEKRFYQNKLGASLDQKLYTCAVLARIDKKELEGLIQRSVENISKDSDFSQKFPELKELDKETIFKRIMEGR